MSVFNYLSVKHSDVMGSCFSADMIEKEMRKLFSIADEKETRLWNRYMSNTFEPLNKPDSTIQDAGLYQGQVGHFLVFSELNSVSSILFVCFLKDKNVCSVDSCYF